MNLSLFSTESNYDVEGNQNNYDEGNDEEEDLGQDGDISICDEETQETQGMDLSNDESMDNDGCVETF